VEDVRRVRRRSALAAYLKSKQGTRKQEGDDIATILEAHLRPAIFTETLSDKAVLVRAN